MSMSSHQRRAFPVFLLLAALLFGSLPARAQAARRPAPEMRKITALGESALSRLRLFLTSLWHPERAKEGMTIDPDGQKPGQQGDEGITIDPDGQ